MAKKYYAIRIGYETGVFYDEWDNVKSKVSGFKNPEFKGFMNRADAEKFLNDSIIETDDIVIEQNGIKIYTDGSFTKNKEGLFSAGGVIVCNANIIHEISITYQDKKFALSRNVAGEVMAVIEALLWCKNNQIFNVTIFVDYQGLISWANGAWESNSYVAKYYLDALEKLSSIKYKFIKVTAHTGDIYNEQADILAKMGSDVGKITPIPQM